MVDLEARLSRRVTELVGIIREYRVRLVADVVTGKLDVREAAKNLPEVSVEPAALDEMEELSQDETEADDLELEATDEA